jgi:hypothetical protein
LHLLHILLPSSCFTLFNYRNAKQCENQRAQQKLPRDSSRSAQQSRSPTRQSSPHHHQSSHLKLSSPPPPPPPHHQVSHVCVASLCSFVYAVLILLPCPCPITHYPSPITHDPSPITHDPSPSYVNHFAVARIHLPQSTWLWLPSTRATCPAHQLAYSGDVSATFARPGQRALRSNKLESPT